jgi:DeoR family transcriptional regulator, suf operon transcriptional repressor
VIAAAARLSCADEVSRNNMSVEAPTSDADVLNLLRIAGPLSVSELSDAMQVTATAVRQRLTRLMSQMMIDREAVRAGRGRPKHRYALTDRGLQQTGSNFTDLAMTLWREMKSIDDEGVRRDLLRRIARALAAGYAAQIKGETPAERLESLAELLQERRIPASVETVGGTATLTTHACPYPKLAEEDPSICTMERMLFSELLGGEVRLTQCRLDGGSDCRFQAG